VNTAWADVVRGSDQPDLGIMDTNFWKDWMASLQAIQRFTTADKAKLGFATTQYMSMDIYLDGGVGGFAGDASDDARNLLPAEQQVPEVPSAQGSQLRRAEPGASVRSEPGCRSGHPRLRGRADLLGAKFNGRVLATTV
jgi:hypothetical protein